MNIITAVKIKTNWLATYYYTRTKIFDLYNPYHKQNMLKILMRKYNYLIAKEKRM